MLHIFHSKYRSYHLFLFPTEADFNEDTIDISNERKGFFVNSPGAIKI